MSRVKSLTTDKGCNLITTLDSSKNTLNSKSRIHLCFTTLSIRRYTIARRSHFYKSDVFAIRALKSSFTYYVGKNSAPTPRAISNPWHQHNVPFNRLPEFI